MAACRSRRARCRRHARVLQDQRRRRRAVQPHLVLFLADRDAGEGALDDERGERLAVDLGEDDEQVGEAAVGDPHLLAVEREAAVGAAASRACLRAERVRARSRLAEAVGADHLAADEPRQVAAASAPRCRTRAAAAIARPVCAPNVVANDAAAPSARRRRSSATLSSSTPPMPRARRCRAGPARRRGDQRARQRPVLLLERVERRQHLLRRRTRPRSGAISRCSSVSALRREDRRRRAVSSISHAPPRTVSPSVSRSVPSLHPLEDAGGAHAAADAHRDQAVARLPAPHLVEQRRRSAGRRCSRADGRARSRRR